MDLGLKDKVAIVTGGSDGIGKATATSLAQEGARVVICARRKDVLEAAAEEIRHQTGGTVLPIQGDVTNPSDVEKVVNGAIEAFGRLDILVNNAGTSAAGPFGTVDATRAPTGRSRPRLSAISEETTCSRAPNQGRRTCLPPVLAEATTTLTMFTGMAKPMPWLPPDCEKMAVLMPMSRPALSTSAPPELPGLMAASVWMKNW